MMTWLAALATKLTPFCRVFSSFFSPMKSGPPPKLPFLMVKTAGSTISVPPAPGSILPESST